MTINKENLKKLNALYVEDDDSIRKELSGMLSNFFGKTYTACDGKDGLEQYLKNQNEINVIISDINMPYLNGTEMVKKIREVNKTVPVIFTTAYSDTQFLSDAIKLKVYEYIIKPIDIRALLVVLDELATILYQNELINNQNSELEKYKDVIDTNNIVIKTDENLKIVYVNELFCHTTEFSKDELIGKDLKYLRHKDTDSKIYDDIYESINLNKPWKGRIKNITKEGGSYISDTYIITTLNDNQEVTGTLCVQNDITEELNKKREIQKALIKDKGDIFIKSKEGSAEQTVTINNLKHDIKDLKSKIKSLQTQRDKSLYKIENLYKENKQLKSELNYQKSIQQKNKLDSTYSLKASKENADLKIKVKKLNVKLEDTIEHYEKKCRQLEVNSQMEIEDLEQELHDIKTKLGKIDNAEMMSQKIEYWKEKAKAEAKKVESLEKEIMRSADRSLINKIFSLTKK
ncbi:response regulator [Arcobacter sp. CECT 8985]|uniref:response regulator n=1 Tax=Arcobacter sp. CECT 8985 TaxID=1935424 RepID=UPI00100B843C|nr:response regulator [Arcobacter sp. CECT 8985]RXJ86792.1 hypothetical protein CRU93_06895 [Arcobacter sp. CECT 8985]